MSKPFSLAVLISGRGSNLDAIIQNTKNGSLNASVDFVFSNNIEAAGLSKAKNEGIETACLDPKSYNSRPEYEDALVLLLKGKSVDLIILAGYMLILGPPLIKAFEGQIVNIHPSLLPSFKGLNTHQKAIGYGVKLSGCTVHFVTEGLDDGPIIMQKAVPVLEDDTAGSLAKRILKEEHKIYSESIQKIINGDIKFQRSKRHEKSIS